jgi:hypothetical protein
MAGTGVADVGATTFEGSPTRDCGLFVAWLVVTS